MTATDGPQRAVDPSDPISRRRIGPARAAMIAAAGVVALLAAGCSSGTSSTPTTTTGASTASTAAGQTPTIAISDYKFVPATLRVTPGETITVANHDQVAHTVTSASGHFDTGDIQPGQSVTLTAPTTAGTFGYICSIHQFMTGTLTVT